MNVPELMVASGYQHRFRSDAWVECCVFGHGESWFGRGLDEQQALANAMAQMLPSRLACHLLEARLNARDEGAMDFDPPGFDAELEEEIDAYARFADPAGEEEFPVLPSGVAPCPPPVPDPEGRVAAPFVSDRPVTVSGLFDALTDEIDEATANDFPLLAPDLMRLQLVAWAGYARDLQDRFADEGAARRAQGVIHRLSKYGKLYWPGTVAPLRHDVSPEEAGRIHGFPDVVRDWFHLAELAEERLGRLWAGRDEYGWADADSLPPPPMEPKARLDEVRTALEVHLGGGSPTVAAFRGLAQGLTRGAVQVLTHAARMLRWLRGTVDPGQWGKAMGRLRRLVGARSEPALFEAIDPGFCPSKSWFLQLRPSVAGARPRVVGPAFGASEAEFVEWLRTTGDGYDLGALRIALRGQTDRLHALDLGVVLSGPNFGALRRRLRRLVEEPASSTAHAEEAVVVGIDEGKSSRDGEATPASEAQPTTMDSVVEQARARTAGLHVLFLGNRADPELQERLTGALGVSLDWCVGRQVRAVQSAAERVRGGAYDFVLLATGFMGHDAEAIVRDAARAGQVPVVRAGKGRVLAAAQAILRDLP